MRNERKRDASVGVEKKKEKHSGPQEMPSMPYVAFCQELYSRVKKA